MLHRHPTHCVKTLAPDYLYFYVKYKKKTNQGTRQRPKIANLECLQNELAVEQGRAYKRHIGTLMVDMID